MGMVEIILICLLVGGIIIFASKSRKQESSGYLADIDWDAIAKHTVQDAIANNQKIEAIKAYRELTGQGLKDAKFAIEYAIKHSDDPLKVRRQRLMDQSSNAGIRDLISEGKIDEAIDTYQKFAGVDKFSAQDAIQQLQDELEHKSSKL